jgi:hypothetical protein
MRAVSITSRVETSAEQDHPQHIGSLPPVWSLFAAVLGVNPLQHLLAANGVLATLGALASLLRGSRYE